MARDLTRIELDFHGFYVLVSETMHNEHVPEGVDHEHRYASVISPHAGGEVRGYRLTADGRAWLGSPTYGGKWPDLDAAVARALEVEVVPYRISPGGIVSYETAEP